MQNNMSFVSSRETMNTFEKRSNLERKAHLAKVKPESKKGSKRDNWKELLWNVLPESEQE